MGKVAMIARSTRSSAKTVFSALAIIIGIGLPAYGGEFKCAPMSLDPPMGNPRFGGSWYIGGAVSCNVSLSNTGGLKASDCKWDAGQERGTLEGEIQVLSNCKIKGELHYVNPVQQIDFRIVGGSLQQGAPGSPNIIVAQAWTDFGPGNPETRATTLWMIQTSDR
jgi:hypothetical protein